MSNYTLDYLSKNGSKYAMQMLLECIKSGEPFVTYGAIKEQLQYQLGIDSIFSTHIGYVAGELMNNVLEMDLNAPLINLLVTRSNGVPSIGAASYLKRKYKNNKFDTWNSFPISDKLLVVEKEREKIIRYKKWDELFNKIYGEKIILKKSKALECDYHNKSKYGSGGESDEHKKLKHWVANNPSKIGIPTVFNLGEQESSLLSGDKMDVLFNFENSYKVVEVKSKISNNEDFKRGIYQCVKYREVKKAEQLPFRINIEAILVTEKELSAELKARAKILDVILKVVEIN
jgi:hypothetical protein